MAALFQNEKKNNENKSEHSDDEYKYLHVDQLQ